MSVPPIPQPPAPTHREVLGSLSEFPQGSAEDRLARAFPTLLWDLKRAVGWSACGPAECARTADADHTIRTALLDSRFLTGDSAIFDQLAKDHLLHFLRGRKEID